MQFYGVLRPFLQRSLTNPTPYILLLLCRFSNRNDDNAVYMQSDSAKYFSTLHRGVARGGPRNLADQLTLFKPWGVDYARLTTASSPGFKMLSTPLITPLMYFRILLIR